MSGGRPIERFACDCAACAARSEAVWERFVSGHEDVANHLRDTWLNPEAVTPVSRLQEYLAATRATGDVDWDDGA